VESPDRTGSQRLDLTSREDPSILHTAVL